MILTTSSSQSEQLDQIERGLDLLFTTEITKEILENVDIEALSNGASYDEAVDYERLSEVLGRTLGRSLGKQLLDRVAGDHFITRIVGSSVAGRLSAIIVRELLNQIEPEELLTGLSNLATEYQFDVDDAIEIPIEVEDETDGKRDE